ncbi:hypothetical protein [Haloarcula amylovorans]|uniref:hypothetical protein n=1 Tax=Haloarcula amylovorans TaxID=2562280 RepID=UPI0010761385|nr:hypothetical protein [Halomicroarcula amylolytica]
MPQALQSRSGSGLVTIPKEYLERDDLLDDYGEPADKQLTVERLDSGMYVIRVCEDDGDLPEIRECPVIDQLASQKAQQLLSENVFGQQQGD